MTKTRILFPLFLGIILLTSFFFTSPVNAISYYNHIQNPSFTIYTNYIEDGSFEAGEENQGLIYGNWSGTGAYWDGWNDATGVYSYQVDTGEHIWYNLTSNYYVLGADIENITCIAYPNGNKIGIRIYYSDFTFDFEEQITAGSGTYSNHTFIDIVDVSRIVVAIYIYFVDAAIYVDDFVMLVDDGGEQDDITENSRPWFFASITPISNGGLNTTYGRLDNTSAYTGYSNSLFPLQQSIEYLDTNYLHFIDLYASSDYGSEIGITVRVHLSDGTSATKTMTLEADGSWEYLNFGLSFVPEDKSITSIRIYLDAQYSTYVYFDDVGIWASVVFGYTRFGFSIAPSPISKTSYSFVAHQNVQYTMNCYLYDENGTLTEEGDFQFSDNTGFTTGSFENGTFSYVLTARASISAFTEQITVTIILTGEVLVFQIGASWYSLAVIPDADETAQQTSDFMFLFIFIVIPSMFLAVILKPVGIPIIGFLSGLTIMSSIGRAVGIIDLWFLFVMVLVCVLIILAMMKRGLYT